LEESAHPTLSSSKRAAAVGLAHALLRSARGSNGIFSCLSLGTKQLYRSSGGGSGWTSGGGWAEGWRSSLDLAAAGLRALGHFGHIVDDSIQFFTIHCRRFVLLMNRFSTEYGASVAANFPPIRPKSGFRQDLHELMSTLRFLAELSRFSAWPQQLPLIKDRTKGGAAADSGGGGAADSGTAAAYEGGFVLRVARLFKWSADFTKKVDDAILKGDDPGPAKAGADPQDGESQSNSKYLRQVQRELNGAVACCLTIMTNTSMEKPLQSTLIVEDLTASMTLFQLEHKEAAHDFTNEVESSRPSYATLKKLMELASRDAIEAAEKDDRGTNAAARFVLEHTTVLMVSQARRVLRSLAEDLQSARSDFEKKAMKEYLDGYKQRLSAYLNEDIKRVIASILERNPQSDGNSTLSRRSTFGYSGMMSTVSGRTSTLSMLSMTGSRLANDYRTAEAYSYHDHHGVGKEALFFETVLTTFCRDELSFTAGGTD